MRDGLFRRGGTHHRNGKDFLTVLCVNQARESRKIEDDAILMPHLKKIHQQQVPQVLFDVCDKALGDLYEYIKRDFLLETCVP